MLNVVHIILVGNHVDHRPNDSNPFAELDSFSDFAPCEIESITNRTRPEVLVFSEMLTQEASGSQISAILLYEQPPQTPDNPLKTFCQVRNIPFFELHFETKDILEKIVEQCTLYDEIRFNLTGGSIKNKLLLVDLARKLRGEVYSKTGYGDLIIVPYDSIAEIQECEDLNPKSENYNDMMLAELKFESILESGIRKYALSPGVIVNIINGKPLLFEDCVLFQRFQGKELFFEVLCLVQLEGFKISSLDKIDSSQLFLKDVLQGLSYFDINVVRLILNDKKGIMLYLGVIKTGKDTKVIDIAKAEMRYLKKHLRAFLPGLELVQIKGPAWQNILEFVCTNQHFGSVVGFPSGEQSDRILSKLENSIGNKKWGWMVLGKALSGKDVKNIIKDIEMEEEIVKTNFREETRGHSKFEEYPMNNKMSISLEPIPSSYRYFQALKSVKQYLERYGDYGIWDTANYIFTAQKSTYDVLFSTVKSHYNCQDKTCLEQKSLNETLSDLLKSNDISTNSFWFPLKIIQLDNVLAQFVKSFQLINIEQGFSISEYIRIFRTLYSSKKLGNFLFLPSYTLTNFQISRVPIFQRGVPEEIFSKFKNPIKIGDLKCGNNERNPFYLDTDTLVRHCLVMGSTGSGKTNTIMNILTQLRKINPKLNFLVIEPIKKEFRHLMNFFDDLEIYTTGENPNPLQINLFEVPSFLSYEQWVNELVEIFYSTFYFWQSLRDILLKSLNEFYRLNGWIEKIRGRTPMLEEFIRYMKLKVDCAEYSAKIRDDLKGVIETRFETLITGTRSTIYKVQKSAPGLDEILQKRVIIELDGLHNDDERALVSNIILRKVFLLQKHAGPANYLRHLTIIEEAHRLIADAGRPMDIQDATIKMKTQDFFRNLLTEIRSFGEGIIISDQEPQRLNPVVITNTNLKICHKLPAIDQILSFKDSLGLSLDQLTLITQLSPGECITKIEEMPVPFIVQIDLFKSGTWGIEKEITDGFLQAKRSRTLNLEQIHYQIGKNDCGEFVLHISELQSRQKGELAIINDPTREQCLSFPNFPTLLWSRLKDFLADYAFCPHCKKFVPAAKKCVHCQEETKKIASFQMPQFQTSFETAVILRQIKLDELIRTHEKIAPSEYSSLSQTELRILKRDFKQLIGDLDNLNEIQEVRQNDAKDSIEECFNNTDSPKPIPQIKSPLKNGTPQDQRLKCKICSGEFFEIEKIELILVRASIQKLVFTLGTVQLRCSKCGWKFSQISIEERELRELKGFQQKLELELYSQLKRNQFCSQCSNFYTEKETCPTHKIPLNVPNLVFVRGLNFQLKSSSILQNTMIKRDGRNMKDETER